MPFLSFKGKYLNIKNLLEINITPPTKDELESDQKEETLQRDYAVTIHLVRKKPELESIKETRRKAKIEAFHQGELTGNDLTSVPFKTGVFLPQIDDIKATAENQPAALAFTFDKSDGSIGSCSVNIYKKKGFFGRYKNYISIAAKTNAYGDHKHQDVIFITNLPIDASKEAALKKDASDHNKDKAAQIRSPEQAMDDLAAYMGKYFDIMQKFLAVRNGAFIVDVDEFAKIWAKIFDRKAREKFLADLPQIQLEKIRCALGSFEAAAKLFDANNGAVKMARKLKDAFLTDIIANYKESVKYGKNFDLGNSFAFEQIGLLTSGLLLADLRASNDLLVTQVTQVTQVIQAFQEMHAEQKTYMKGHANKGRNWGMIEGSAPPVIKILLWIFSLAFIDTILALFKMPFKALEKAINRKTSDIDSGRWQGIWHSLAFILSSISSPVATIRGIWQEKPLHGSGPQYWLNLLSKGLLTLLSIILFTAVLAGIVALGFYLWPLAAPLAISVFAPTIIGHITVAVASFFTAASTFTFGATASFYVAATVALCMSAFTYGRALWEKLLTSVVEFTISCGSHKNPLILESDENGLHLVNRFENKQITALAKHTNSKQDKLNTVSQLDTIPETEKNSDGAEWDHSTYSIDKSLGINNINNKSCEYIPDIPDLQRSDNDAGNKSHVSPEPTAAASQRDDLNSDNTEHTVPGLY